MSFLLPLVILLPLLVGAAVVAVPGLEGKSGRAIALATAAAELGLSLIVLVAFRIAPGFQLTASAPWIPAWGATFSIGVDGLNVFLVVLTALMGLLALVYGVKDPDRGGRFGGWLLVLVSGLMAALLATDLLLFYVAWELMLVPMIFLMGLWGGAKRVGATVKFVIYTMGGSLLMLAGVIAVAWQGFAAHGRLSFAYGDLVGLHVPPVVAIAAFLGFAAAFAVKVPLVPLHAWLPDAYVEAPVPGTLMLSAVMAKLGVYGFLRWAFPLFPAALPVWGTVVLGLGALGVVYAGFLAVGQSDPKRLVAYSSASHMGMIMVGVGAWNAIGLSGSVLQMLNHAVATGALFLLVGWLADRVGDRPISELGGLVADAPIFATAFLLTVLASAGLPGLNGFIGEFLILCGAFGRSPGWTAVAALGVILVAVYLLWFYGRTFFGAAHPERARIADLSGREVALVLPLLVLMVGLGVFPQPVLDRIAPATSALAGVTPHVAVSSLPRTR